MPGSLYAIVRIEQRAVISEVKRTELSDLLVGHVRGARPVIGQTYRLTVGPSKFQLVRAVKVC